MVAGECNCGIVAFETKAEVSDVFICHCSICRRSTGTNGMAVVIVDIGKFRWCRGQEQIVKWLKPNHDWENSFCKVCGSNLPGANDEARM